MLVDGRCPREATSGWEFRAETVTGRKRGDMNDERGLLPVDLSLPQTTGAVFPFRIALGHALNRLMTLKAAADEVIAEHMGDRTEAVVDGVTYLSTSGYTASDNTSTTAPRVGITTRLSCYPF